MWLSLFFPRLLRRSHSELLIHFSSFILLPSSSEFNGATEIVSFSAISSITSCPTHHSTIGIGRWGMLPLIIKVYFKNFFMVLLNNIFRSLNSIYSRRSSYHPSLLKLTHNIVCQRSMTMGFICGSHEVIFPSNRSLNEF